MRLCVLVWLFFFFFFKYNYILIFIYLRCCVLCVERQQAAWLSREGVAAARLSHGGVLPMG